MSADHAESTHARALRLTRHANEAVRDLRLVTFEESGVLGRYYLRGHWWSWVEVITLRGGHMLVHGDIDAVIFGGCHGHTSPRHVLEWMAYADYDYAQEKASIGSSGKIAREFEPAVAMSYVLDWRRHKIIEREGARRLYNTLRWGCSQHEFIEALAHVLDDSEYYDAGECTDRRVFNAQAVLRKLCFWLDSIEFREKARAWFPQPRTA